MNASDRLQIFNRLAQANPKPKTELQYDGVFQLLVAVVLSAQATDKGVNKATAALFSCVKSPQDILKLGENGLKRHIKTIGLFNTKAANIIKLCQRLVEMHGGKVPNNRQQLEALAGVGRKTANVVLNTAFGEPVIAVDTHVFRVANRTGLAVGKNVLQVETRLAANTPKQHKLAAHHLLILHGRYTCTARKPRCHTCLIADYCSYQSKTALLAAGNKVD